MAKVKLVGRFANPEGGPERSATADTVLDRRHFGFCQRRVDAINPVVGTGHRPVGHEPRIERVLPPPKGAPWPGFRLANQPGAQCVTFHIAANGQEMSVALHWEALEAILVNMPLPGRAMRHTKSLSMGSREIPEKAR